MPSPDPLGERLVDLARALRRHGVTVGTSEVADAASAARALGLDDRERLRTGLAATMMRRSADRAVFDQLFDIHFPPAVGHRTGDAAALEPTDTAGARERAAVLRRADPVVVAVDDEVLDLDDAELAAAVGALEGGWLAPEAVVVVERPARAGQFSWPDVIEPIKHRRYGEAVLWYGRRR